MMPIPLLNPTLGDKFWQDTTVVVLPEEMTRQMRVSVAGAVFSPGSKGGTVVVESAPSGTFWGQWKVIGTLTWHAGGQYEEIQLSGMYLALRLRISESVRDGTVELYFGAN